MSSLFMIHFRGSAGSGLTMVDQQNVGWTAAARPAPCQSSFLSRAMVLSRGGERSLETIGGTMGAHNCGMHWRYLPKK